MRPACALRYDYFFAHWFSRNVHVEACAILRRSMVVITAIIAIHENGDNKLKSTVPS